MVTCICLARHWTPATTCNYYISLRQIWNNGILSLCSMPSINVANAVASAFPKYHELWINCCMPLYKKFGRHWYKLCTLICYVSNDLDGKPNYSQSSNLVLTLSSKTQVRKAFHPSLQTLNLRNFKERSILNSSFQVASQLHQSHRLPRTQDPSLGTLICEAPTSLFTAYVYQLISGVT